MINIKYMYIHLRAGSSSLVAVTTFATFRIKIAKTHDFGTFVSLMNI